MSVAIAEPRARRWTREEYYRLAEEGWFSNQRVQLIRGEILRMAPQGSPHSIAILRVVRFLSGAFGDEFWVRSQMPLDVADHSQPEPDIAVTAMPAGPVDPHPKTAVLVAEVSDLSLRLDRRKAGLYAAAKIPEYWIVNLQSQKVEVYRDPVVDVENEFGSRYSAVQELGEEDMIAPLAGPEAEIQVKKFFE